MTTTSAPRDATATATASGFTRKQRKAILAGSVGNAVEWLDWALYATLAPLFASQFFPSSDPSTALLATLAVFAVGFLMRPIGGAVLGAYADRHGRKKGLVLTIGLMAGSSILIGLIPTFGAIGILAPILLLLIRLAQGFSAGGEFGSSSSFLVESAAPGRRAFAGSWQQVSVATGVLLASVTGFTMTSLLGKEAVASWGWRVAFIVAGLLGLVGLWLRVSVDETDSFTRATAEGKTNRKHPLTGLLRDHPKAALRVVAITIPGTLLYYMWMSYMPGYAKSAMGIDLNRGFLANIIAAGYFICLLPLVAILSDKFGRKPTLLAFAGGFLVFAYPAFQLLEQGTFSALLVVELIGVTFLAGYSANCAVIMSEQFPPEVRATGIGLPYALAVAVFGGTAPYITTWMATAGYRDLTWIYVSVAALIGVVVYATMPETKDKEFV